MILTRVLDPKQVFVGVYGRLINSTTAKIIGISINNIYYIITIIKEEREYFLKQNRNKYLRSNKPSFSSSNGSSGTSCCVVPGEYKINLKINDSNKIEQLK